MDTKKLISFDLKADFGFFRKPDLNSGMVLSYNMLHKPALLGILGAITGLSGYEKYGDFPEYYKVFKDIPIGIAPLDGFHEKGNFQKTNIKYTNTVGYANADGNLLIEENTLIKPAYKCFVLFDLAIAEHQKAHNNIMNCCAEYVPYFGKNEFSTWWNLESVEEYSFEEFTFDKEFRIDSLFIKNYSNALKSTKKEPKTTFKGNFFSSSFSYFERLPIGFNENLKQYELAEMAFTDWWLMPETELENLYKVENQDFKYIIQLI